MGQFGMLVGPIGGYPNDEANESSAPTHFVGRRRPRYVGCVEALSPSAFRRAHRGWWENGTPDDWIGHSVRCRDCRRLHAGHQRNRTTAADRRAGAVHEEDCADRIVRHRSPAPSGTRRRFSFSYQALQRTPDLSGIGRSDAAVHGFARKFSFPDRNRPAPKQ